MKRIVFITVFYLVSLISFAQSKDFKVYSETDTLKIEYKWTHSKPFNKKSPLALDVKITNKKDFCVKGTVTVNYYDKTVIKSSNDKIAFCVPAKKHIRGRKHKLAFVSNDIPNEFYSSDDFKFEVEIEDLKKTSKCK